MVETFFLDWGLSFGAGILFAAAGRNEIASARSLLRSRAFRVGFAWLIAGVLGVALLLYAINPDWMWMYFFQPRLPGAVVALAFALYPIAFVAGFALGAELASAARVAGWAAAAAVGGVITAAEYATRERLFNFGTFIEYVSGQAGGAFGEGAVPGEVWVLLGWGVPSVVALAALAAMIWRRDRRPETRATEPPLELSVKPA